MSSNKYTARLSGKEARELAKQPFVDAIRLYAEDDTLPAEGDVSTRRSTRGTANVRRFTLLHAVRLHRVGGHSRS